MKNLFKFLQAAMSLSRQGVKKEDILRFAKQEFGEVTDEIKQIVNRIYSRNKSQKPKTKDEERGKVIPFKKKEDEGIMSNVTDRLAAEAKKLEDMMKDFKPGFTKNPYRSDGPLNPKTGMVRTAARQFLQKEAREGRLKILDDRERDAITKGYQGGVDPIEVLRKYYGEDALEQIDLVSDELMNAQNYDEVLEILDNADIKRFKPRDIPGYDPNVRDSARVLKELEEEAKGNKAKEDNLEDIKNFFKDDDPEDFATGGRVGYAVGTGIKLVRFFGSLKKLEKAIKDAVDNLNFTGDKKLDADMAVDDMLEEAGIDRDTVDQYDLIDAYGKAYDQIVKGADELPGFPKIKSESSKNVFDEVDVELEKQFPGVTKEIQSSKSVERLKLMEKYPGIDEKLLDQILIDDNPQRKAEVLATLDEAFKMLEKGMSPDEILDAVKKTPRTKQAMGTGPDGLSEITELFEKIKIKNENKRAEKEADKQVRYRKLIESNKFPELNEFFQAKLNESNGDMDLEVRTNFAVGSSPFTAEQLAQKKQQSYIDYLARQGKGMPTTGTGTGTSTSGVNNISVFKEPTSLATSTGTGGTSTTTGGTSGGGTTSTGTVSPGPTAPRTIPSGSGGMTSGGGSSGGSSTGSSGGATSSGGSNVYTGSGNLPPSMQTGSSTSSGSSLTPNTGNVNVGGGGFGDSSSLLGGPPGQINKPGFKVRHPETGQMVDPSEIADDWQRQNAIDMAKYDANKELKRVGTELYNILSDTTTNEEYQQREDEFKEAFGEYGKGFSGDPKKALEYINKYLNYDLKGGFESKYGDEDVTFGYGGSDVNISKEDYLKRLLSDQQSFLDRTNTPEFQELLRNANNMYFGAPVDTGDLGSEAANMAATGTDQGAPVDTGDLKSEAANVAATGTDQSATADGFEDQSKDMGATADEGFEEVLSSNPKEAYTQMGGGADFAQITSLPETTQVAQSIQGETNDKNILQKANEFATKHGKTITAASYLLDAVIPGLGQTIRKAQAVNKGYNLVAGAVDSAMNDVLTKPTGIGGQVDLNETLFKGTTPEPEYDGNIGSIFFSEGGRVGFRYGSEDAKVKKYMKTDYSNPFNRLTKRDIGRHKAYNSAVLKKGKKMISADKKKKKNLLTLNEQARAKALQRLALLKRLYGGV